MTDTRPRPSPRHDDRGHGPEVPDAQQVDLQSRRPRASPAHAPRIAAMSRTIARPPAEPRRKMKSAVLNVPTRAARSGAGPIAIRPSIGATGPAIGPGPAQPRSAGTVRSGRSVST